MKWQIAAAVVGLVAGKQGDVVRCEGTQKEVQACVNQPCAQEDCQDCAWGVWSTWGACNCEGLQERHRTIHQQSHCGIPCTGAKVQTKKCTPECEKVIPGTDCMWGDWSAWGACSQECGGGQQTRDRHVKIAPRNGGQLCAPYDKTETQPCNTQPCDAGCINGAWSEWSSWGECSASCGQGYQARSRKVDRSPNSCGNPVSGPETEYQQCTLSACTTTDVPCQFSEWSNWSDCSCSCNGIRDRSRRIANYAQGNGKGCVGPLKETTPCNTGICDSPNPIDCEVTEWHDWSECTAECGGGSQSRARGIAVYPKNGGKPCNHILREIQTCNNQPCQGGVDCTWGEWGDWGACTRGCGTGQQTRFRHIIQMPEHGGIACASHDNSQTRSCNQIPCGSVNYCAWNDWSEWSTCSQTCGTGEQVRSRQLALTDVRPTDDKMILASEILDQLNSMDGIFSLEHLAFMFVGGMVCSVTGLLVGYVLLRRRNTQQFDQVNTQEPLIE